MPPGKYQFNFYNTLVVQFKLLLEFWTWLKYYSVKHDYGMCMSVNN